MAGDSNEVGMTRQAFCTCTWIPKYDVAISQLSRCFTYSCICWQIQTPALVEAGVEVTYQILEYVCVHVCMCNMCVHVCVHCKTAWWLAATVTQRLSI